MVNDTPPDKADIYDTPLGTSYGMISTFSDMTDNQRFLSALWVAHTHTFRTFPVSPRMYCTATEFGAGKSNLMTVCLAMCADPLMTTYMSQATLYNWLDKHPDSTIAVDEADQHFGTSGRTTGRNIMIAVLNGGYTSKGMVVVTRGSEPAQIPVYAPVILAGKGSLPDALQTRSLVINLHKGTPETVYIPEEHDSDLHDVGADLHDWLHTSESQTFMKNQPNMAELPIKVDPRMLQIFAPLQAIAKLAGLESRFDEAMREVLTGMTDVKVTTGEQFLMDIRAMWPEGVTALDANGVRRALSSSQWHFAPGRVGDIRIAGLFRENGVESRVINGARGYQSADIVAEVTA